MIFKNKSQWETEKTTNKDNKKGGTSCESQKLQNLWEKLQDLSEVQDQSRNQQMPIFLDDNSMMSKSQQNDSFFRTIELLDEDNLKRTSSQTQKYFHHQHAQKYQGNNIENERNVAGYQQNYSYSKNFNNVEPSYSPMGNFHQFSNYDPINKQAQQYISPFSSTSRNNLLSYNKQNQQIRQETLIKTNSQKELIKNQKQNNQNGKQKTSKLIFNNQAKQIQQKSLRQIEQKNNKLTQDNIKLFEECIKLRKIISLTQVREKQWNTNYAQLKYQAQNNKLRVQIQGLKQQLKKKQQQINQLILENNQIRKSSQSIKSPEQQTKNKQMQLLSLKQIIQSQFQLKYRTQIKRLQDFYHQKQIQLQGIQQIVRHKNSIIQSKQQQLTLLKINHSNLNKKFLELQKEINIKNFTIQKLQKELSFKNSRSIKKYNNLKLEYGILQITILKNQNHNLMSKNQVENIHKVNSFYNQQKEVQKLSRANSIKSTSISYNSSNGGYDSSIGIENILKDKERTIKNMKIVHQAQNKKLKLVINQLQAKIAKMAYQTKINI